MPMPRLRPRPPAAKTIVVSSEEIRSCSRSRAVMVVDAVQDDVDKCPRSFSGDIMTAASC